MDNSMTDENGSVVIVRQPVITDIHIYQNVEDRQELIKNNEVCAICLVRFASTYENLKIVRSTIEKILEEGKED